MGEPKWDEKGSAISDLVDKALTSGPQIITRKGDDAAVVLSLEDYKRLSKDKSKHVVDLFLNSPLVGEDLDLDRDKTPGRRIEL